MIDDSAQTGAPTHRRVELRSDTFTLPTAEMRQAMVTAELGDDVYGEDPTVRALEVLSARILGKDAGCFMPSGTMGNLASLLSHCPRGSKVIVGDESDAFLYEAGGAAVCGGLIYHPVPNRADGTLDLGAVEAALSFDPDDPQFARPALLCLENPHNRCGGKVLPMSHLSAVRALADERRLAVHLDGSRIFNASLSSGVAVDEIAGYADSVQFCLSKGLGAPVGSMVVGDGPFVEKVRRVRKMLGGGMRQSGVLASAGIVALQDIERLRQDHELAQYLADGLASIPGIEVESAEERTNMVFFRVAVPGLDNPRFLAAAEARGVRLAELGHGRIRSVTHRGVGRQDIDYTLEVIRSILGERPDRLEPVRKSDASYGPTFVC